MALCLEQWTGVAVDYRLFKTKRAGNLVRMLIIYSLFIKDEMFYFLSQTTEQ